MHRRHHLGGGVEGVLAHDRMPVQQRPPSEVRVQPGAQQRNFHRIATAAVLCAVEMRVVAEHGDTQQQDRLWVVGEARGFGAPWRDRFDLDLTQLHAEPSHRHAVLGQGAGLVGEDDSGGAERLDRRKALDQCVLSCHAPHATREHQCRHDREALGNRRHGERDRSFDHQERILTGSEADGGDRRRHDQRHPDELCRQPGELALERRAARMGFEDKLRHPSELGRKPRRHHHTDTAAARHGCALEQHRKAVAETCVAGDRLRLLVHGD